jgi:sugar phosphate isomerase/epimerase
MTLGAGCVPRIPFRRQVAAARAAGFDALTCWPNVWRHALRKDGLTFDSMRALLDENELGLTAVEAVGGWAGPRSAAADGTLPSNVDADEAFTAALALGAGVVATAHTMGATDVTEGEVAAFGDLCDRAGEHGLRVALEFVPMTGVPSLAAARAVLAAADRANAGLVVDSWHLARSGGRPDDLRDVPADQILLAQLADGPADASTDLLAETTMGRLLPGTGAMHVVEMVAVLAEAGVTAPIGPEVYLPDWADRPEELAAVLYEASRRVLDAAAEARR